MRKDALEKSVPVAWEGETVLPAPNEKPSGRVKVKVLSGVRAV
jgi:hypothetical protein